MAGGFLLEITILIAVVVVLFAAPVVFVVARARWLTRLGGSFDCALRLDSATPGAGWALGVARYSGEELQWFRYYAASMSPKLRLDRTTASVLEVRDPEPIEAVALYSGNRIVRVEYVGRLWDLAMSGESVTGMLSWLESAPPGQRARPTSPDTAW